MSKDIIDSGQLVVKDNNLINAGFNLSLVEQRLILLAIVQARKTNIDINSELAIHAEEYSIIFNTTMQASYQALKEAGDTLFERRFSYKKRNAKGNIEYAKSRWVQNVKYVPEEATIKLTFAIDVLPMILNLGRNFTSYSLNLVKDISSAYGLRLYEILSAWKDVGKTPIIRLPDFKAQLGLNDGEYERMDNFKRKVLDVAVEQVNTKTDIFTEYEQHYAGKKIVGFSFSVIVVEEENNEIIEIPEPKPEILSLKEFKSNCPKGMTGLDYAIQLKLDGKSLSKEIFEEYGIKKEFFYGRLKNEMKKIKAIKDEQAKEAKKKKIAENLEADDWVKDQEEKLLDMQNKQERKNNNKSEPNVFGQVLRELKKS